MKVEVEAPFITELSKAGSRFSVHPLQILNGPVYGLIQGQKLRSHGLQ